MSASLVGSEMCIRDRAWPPRCAVRGARGQPPRPRRPMPASAPARSPWPCLLYTSDAADDM
eukprot:3627217-Alexandrium_andersonii.AAC.1